MPEAWLDRAVEGFWTAAGSPAPFPREMRGPVETGLPASVVPLPRLTLAAVRQQLARLGLDALGHGPGDRPLRGCLVAWRGQGRIFVDRDDPPDEARFTLAHEAAHLLCDHLLPRQDAIARLGPDVVAVLDGLREPTDDERLDAALRRARLGPDVHLMERDGPSTVAAEERADRLAVELLAPTDEVLRRLDDGARRDSAAQAARARALLVEQFALPASVAAERARWLGPATARAGRMEALLRG